MHCEKACKDLAGEVFSKCTKKGIQAGFGTVDGVLGFTKANIHFEEKEFDRKLANGYAELVFEKKCRIIQI
jgi:hypothetical protein